MKDKEKDDTHFKKGANELKGVEKDEAKEDRAHEDRETGAKAARSDEGGYGSKGIKADMKQCVSHLAKEKDWK